MEGKEKTQKKMERENKEQREIIGILKKKKEGDKEEGKVKRVREKGKRKKKEVKRTTKIKA